ncbi:MAG: NUDIX hydrolase, partial [Candidatus Margulisiibacteriota bacterium]
MKDSVYIKIYSVIKDGDTVILTQDEEGQPGWKFPGGHIEKGELLISTALREVVEETGFKINATGALLIEDFFNRKRPDEHDMRFFIIAELIGGEEKLKSG